MGGCCWQGHDVCGSRRIVLRRAASGAWQAHFRNGWHRLVASYAPKLKPPEPPQQTDQTRGAHPPVSAASPITAAAGRPHSVPHFAPQNGGQQQKCRQRFGGRSPRAPQRQASPPQAPSSLPRAPLEPSCRPGRTDDRLSVEKKRYRSQLWGTAGGQLRSRRRRL